MVLFAGKNAWHTLECLESELLAVRCYIICLMQQQIEK